MGLETASQYVITHVMYASLPHSFAVFLLEDLSERKEAVLELKKLVLATLKASLVVKSGEASEALKEALQDLGWTKMQVSLEMIGLMLQADFDPSNETCIRYAKRIFTGSSSTKDVLEAVFAHLRDVSFKANKNQGMAPSAKFFYATTATSPEAGGHKRLLPSNNDLVAYLHRRSKDQNFEERMIYDMRTTLLPVTGKFDISPDTVLKKTWRPAGPLSHQRAAAAGKLLMEQADLNFRDVSNAWAGRVFLRCFFRCSPPPENKALIRGYQPS